MANSRHILKSLKAQAQANRSGTEKFADWTASVFGSIPFFIVHIIWFGGWILVNTASIPGIPHFDPFPYGLLTMVVSLEAIFLSILVLLSQNRASEVDDLREEVDLQVDVISEKEITKLLHLTTLLLEKNGIEYKQDKELEHMLKKTNLEKMQMHLEEEISNGTLKISQPTTQNKK